MKFAVDMHSEKLSGLVLNLACENAEIFHEYLDQVTHSLFPDSELEP